MSTARLSRSVVFQPSRWVFIGAAASVLAGAQALPAPAADPAVVFVSRLLNGQPAPNERSSPVERAQSGKLLLLLPSRGQPITLVDAASPQAQPGTPVDVIDPDVSYDASRIVFAGFVQAESAWRIFEVNVDAAGKASGLRQITHSDRQIDLSRFGYAAARLQSYDDVDPCYLPDGRICFVSTRYPGIAPDGRVRATNLFVVNAGGSDLHRITTERFGADTPAVDPTSGRIVYSRWWRTAQSLDLKSGSVPDPIPPGSPGYGDVDPGTGSQGSGISPEVVRGVDPASFPGVNSWFLASIAPDGTGLQMHSGFRLDREQTQAYRPSFFPNGDAVALFIPRTPFLGFPGPNGLRRYSPGASLPVALGGPQTFAGDTKPVPQGDQGPFPPLPPFTSIVYQSAVPLADGRILVSASVGGSDFNIYIQDANLGAAARPLRDIPETAELDPVPFVARPVPPVVNDSLLVRMKDDIPATVEQAKRENGTFTFRCDNVHFNGPVDMAIATAPPVGKRLSIEFYMVPQRTGVTAPDPPILIDSKEIAPDGKIEAELPAGVPLFELLRRPDDSIALGRDGQIFHVGGMNFGEADQKGHCVGCHAGHSMLEVPLDATWTNLAPSALVSDGSVATAAVGKGGPDAAGAVGDPARGGVPFSPTSPQALVDRRTDPGAGEWAAAEVKNEHQLSFRWSVPIRAKDVAVHGPTPRDGVAGKSPLPVTKAFTVSTYLGAAQREKILVTQEAVPAGTHVALNPELDFDRLMISIRKSDVVDSAGAFPGPVLSEVEVLARATAAGPTISFVRGDANCDTVANFSDAFALIGGLFQGQPFCCTAAADANADDHVSLTDAVYLLDYLFQGGDPIASPTEQDGPCMRVGEQSLVCDQESCS